MNYQKLALKLHAKYHGKIEVVSKVPLKKRSALSWAYTPGVGAVCLAIEKDPKLSKVLTNRANTVAVISDGTAILGLGNIGPEAGMPVMEGKAAIFKEFAKVDAYPLCIRAKSVDEIVAFCKAIEPSCAGINLEDIAAPHCFALLARLEQELSIPVFHDDQDGTAIVVLAALMNACNVTGKDMRSIRIAVNGAGAAGIAITRLLATEGIKNVILVDTNGTIYKGRSDMNIYKQAIAEVTNQSMIQGGLQEALKGADVFIGVSKANMLTGSMIKAMNPDPIIFALANPNPEIMPQEAWDAGASVVATGRSDFPNQVNNALVFPGLFRGLLDSGVQRVTVAMKQRVAHAIAQMVAPTKNKLLPLITNKLVVPMVAKAVMKEARKEVASSDILDA